MSHDHGLKHDLPRLIGRRALLAGVGALPALAATSALAADACIADPQETSGPYPGDGTNSKDGQVVNVLTQSGIIREDIRPSFGDMTPVAEGLPLTMELKLQSVTGCTPLVGYAVYLWHCDAAGRYSLYDYTDRNYLRGVGVSDAEGIVRFTTNFPGCYDGRWPHMHFEVFASPAEALTGRDSLLISQLAMPEAEANAVYAAQNTLYSRSAGNLATSSIAGDNVFGDNTEAQIAQQTPVLTGDAETGYAGTATIALTV